MPSILLAMLLLALTLIGTVVSITSPFQPGWNGLARTPPMGWRSWNSIGPRCNQNDVEANMNLLVNRSAFGQLVSHRVGKSLWEIGYTRVGIDEGWEACGAGVNGTQHDASGRPVINQNRFPNMSKLVEHGHSNQLLVGWYQNGCACGESVSRLANYQGDVSSLFSLGFDGVKFDGCGAQNNMSLYAEIMQKTGKAFEVEDCKAGDCSDDDNSGCPRPNWCPFTTFRASRDIDNTDTRWFLNLQSMRRFLDREKPLSQQHCWAYGDMLEVGRLSTYELSRAHFGAWCITSSPLILGIDLRHTEAVRSVWPIIANSMAIRINQQWAGHPGYLVKSWSPHPDYSQHSSLPELWASMLYQGCDSSSATQNGWSYNASSESVIFNGSLCLDRSIKNHLALVPCSGSLAQKFKCEAWEEWGTPSRDEEWGGTFGYGDESGDDGSNVGRGGLKHGIYRDGKTCRLVSELDGLCVDCNDWNWNNVFMAPCGRLHYQTTQNFTFHADGTLSSIQGDNPGPIVRCLAAVTLSTRPNATGPGSAEDRAPQANPVQLWAKPQPNGSLAILLLNMFPSSGGSPNPRDFNVTIDLKVELGLNAQEAYLLTDVWQGSVVRSVVGNLTIIVNASDSAFYLLTPQSMALRE